MMINGLKVKVSLSLLYWCFVCVYSKPIFTTWLTRLALLPLVFSASITHTVCLLSLLYFGSFSWTWHTHLHTYISSILPPSSSPPSPSTSANASMSLFSLSLSQAQKFTLKTDLPSQRPRLASSLFLFFFFKKQNNFNTAFLLIYLFYKHNKLF